MSRGFQAIGTVAALMVLLAIIWSLIQGDPDPSASWVQQNKWFVVTIVDVYAGLGLAIALMWVLEDGPKRMIYAVLFLVLGNLGVGAWVALRLMGNPAERCVRAKR